jgi:cell division protein FtsW
MVSAIIFAIGFQSFLNMGVVLGVLPTKGLNLPFISYGGSSMVANLAALGLVFACIRIQPSDLKAVKEKGKQSPMGALRSAFSS